MAGYFTLWIVMAIIVGFIGQNKSLRFWGSFIISLLLSPLIGIIAVLISKDREAISEVKIAYNNGLINDEEYTEGLLKVSRRIEGEDGSTLGYIITGVILIIDFAIWVIVSFLKG